MDDDLTMLVGPAPDGWLLDIGVLDVEAKTRSSSMRCRCARSSSRS